MIEAEHKSAAHRRSFVIRTIYALCLFGATYNHATTILQHGLSWDYGDVPRASATFWTALAVLDPAAVILLFVRPNVGVSTTVAIIVADVIHNVWIVARYDPPLLHGLANAPQVIEQIAFMVFVLITAPFAWRPKRRAPSKGFEHNGATVGPLRLVIVIRRGHSVNCWKKKEIAMLQAQLSGRKLTVYGTAADGSKYSSVPLSISPVSLSDNDLSLTQVTVTGSASGPISRVDLRGITNTGVVFYDFSAESDRLTVIGTSHDDRMTSFFDTPVRDFFRGGGGDDSFDSGFGNDGLEGGSGNDFINGGAGKDVAYYSGDRSDYRIEIVDGDYQITDRRRGRPDGHDTVGNIETLHFADKDLALASPSKLVAVADGRSLTLSGHASTPYSYVRINLDDETIEDNNSTGTFVNIRGNHHDLRMLDLSGLRDAGAQLSVSQGMAGRHVIGSAQNDYLSLSFGKDLATAGDDSDFVAGWGGNDRLYGQDGNDTLSGGAGNDRLVGGRGDDTALYSGVFADYSVVYVNGSYQVTDNTPGGGYDGVDILSGVEHLSFSDQTVDLNATALQSHSIDLNPEIAGLMAF